MLADVGAAQALPLDRALAVAATSPAMGLAVAMAITTAVAMVRATAGAQRNRARVQAIRKADRPGTASHRCRASNLADRVMILTISSRPAMRRPVFRPRASPPATAITSGAATARVALAAVRVALAAAAAAGLAVRAGRARSRAVKRPSAARPAGCCFRCPCANAGCRRRQVGLAVSPKATIIAKTGQKKGRFRTAYLF